MKPFITVILLLQVAVAFAQQRVVIFYTSQWKNIRISDDRALYYRKASVENIQKPVFNGKVEDFFVLGEKHMTGFYKAGKKHGAFEFFHDNGKLAKKGYYKNGQRYGNWTYWYPNGQKKQVIRYTTAGFSVLEYYNDEGKQLLKDGTGIWVSPIYHRHKLIGVVRGAFQHEKRNGIWKYYATYDLKIPLFKEMYEAGQKKQVVKISDVSKYSFNEFESGISFNNADQWVVDKSRKRRAKLSVYLATVLEKKPNILLDINQIPVDGNDQKLYKKTDQPAKPLMGIDNLYKYLRYNIQLPPEARTHGIRRGKVRVSFVIEKDGKISNIQILKGMGGGYDQEALRLVKGFPRFVPAIHQGKRVRVQKKIPIVFQ